MAVAPPAFQFYAGDFLVSTTTLSNAQVGAYIRLLAHQWVNIGIPPDLKLISKIVHETVPRTGRLMDAIRSKFVLYSDGLLKNPRLEEVRQKQQKYLALQAVNGKKGGRPRTKTQKASLSGSEKGSQTLSSSSSSSNSVRRKNAAAPLTHPVENSRRKKEPPNVSVLAAMILKENVLQEARIADQAEAAKCCAARHHLSYDSRSIANALASASAQAAKRGTYDS
jgi:uncharacterized protein YdaU (DUF1376 family)